LAKKKKLKKTKKTKKIKKKSTKKTKVSKAKSKRSAHKPVQKKKGRKTLKSGEKPRPVKAKRAATLSRKDVDLYKVKLLEMRRKITQDMTQLEENAFMNTRDASGELSGHTFHMADVATDNNAQELNLGLASSEQSLLNRIEAALKRIDEGTYGLSVKSGKSITKKRLMAVPYAELTVEEQEEEEKKRKLGG